MKKRFLSVLLSLTLLFTMFPMVLGTAGLTASAEGDDLVPVELYWTRSKEFLYEELEKASTGGLSVYDMTMELEAKNGRAMSATYNADTGVITYSVTVPGGTRNAGTYAAGTPGAESYPGFTLGSNVQGVIRTADGPKVVTTPATYNIADLISDPKLGIMYADARLTNGTAPASIRAYFQGDNLAAPTNVMGDITYVWDGGSGTYSGSNVVQEFGQVQTTATGYGTPTVPGGSSLPAVPAISTNSGTITGVSVTPVTVNFGWASGNRYWDLGSNFRAAIDYTGNTGSYTKTISTSGIYYLGISDNNNPWVWGNNSADPTYAPNLRSVKVTVLDSGAVFVDCIDQISGDVSSANFADISYASNVLDIDIVANGDGANAGTRFRESDSALLSFVIAQANDILNDTATYDWSKYDNVQAFRNAVAAGEAMITAGTYTKAQMDTQANAIVSAAAAVVPTPYQGGTINLTVAPADTGYGPTLDVVYLPTNSGYAGTIKSIEYAALNITADNTIPDGAYFELASSASDVAYVSDRGYVYPRGAGNAIITVTLKQANGTTISSASCTIACMHSFDNSFTDTVNGAGEVVGRFENGVENGNELGLSGSSLRSGTAVNINNFATWLCHAYSNVGSPDVNDFDVRGAETVRRFTAYFEITPIEYANHASIFLGDHDGNTIFAGDDSVYIFVNGQPAFRASTNGFGGVDIVGIDGTGFNAANTLTLSNNTQNATTTCNQDIAGTACGISQHTSDYAYAAGWHVHTDGSSVNIKSYIKPGQVNRIDIIAGDYDDGGGFTRPYLWLSQEEDIYKTGAIKVTELPFADRNYINPFDFYFENVEAEVVEQNTDVFYGFEVENTSESTTLTNIELVEDVLGIKITKDGVYKKDGNGQYTVQVIDFSDPTYATEFADVVTGLTSLDAGDSFIINLPGYVGNTPVAAAQYQIGADEPLDNDGYAYRTNSVTASGSYIPAAGLDPVTVSAMDDTYVKLGGTKELADDVAVIDYGLAINIPVLENDGLTNGAIYGLNAANSGNISHDVDKTAAEVSAFSSSSANLTYGTAAVSGSNVVYTPNKIVNSIDTVYYAAGESDKYGVAKVTVVPATSVYYEDNFSNAASTAGDALAQVQAGGIVYSGNWSIVNTAAKNADGTIVTGTSSALRVQTYDNEALYGYDAAYNVVEAFSGGSAHGVGQKISEYTMAEMLADDGPYGAYPYVERFKRASRILASNAAYTSKDVYYATFTFAGTGFDVISHTATDSGRITAKVYKLEEGKDYSFDSKGLLTTNATLVQEYKADNVYTDGALYQVPVITLKNLPADEYVVQLSVKAGSDYSINSTGNIVYLDAIRIYNPLDATDSAAKATYYTDEELGAVRYELRSLILKGNGEEGDTISGVDLSDNAVSYIIQSYVTESAFIEEGYSASDYLKFGPQHEVYTKSGDGFAFTYSGNGAANQTLQLEAKTLDPADAAFTVTARNQRTGVSTTAQIRSGTAMFYDLTAALAGAVDGDVIILNIANTDSDAVLSLTNIKISSSATLGAVASAPTSVTITEGDSINLTHGATTTLHATVAPASTLNKAVTWESSNSEVVSVVSGTGVITVNGTPGQSAVITVKSVADNTVIDTITVNVVEVTITGINMLKNGTVVANGGSTAVNNSASTITFTAATLPTEAADNYTMSVSGANAAIATVSADGKTVIVDPSAATASGSVVITATANGFTATHTVNVTVVVPATGIMITRNGADAGASIAVNSTDASFNLAAVVTPANASDTSYTFISSNPAIATVNGTTVTVNPAAATADATVTITASANGGTNVTDSITINVTKIYNPESIMITRNGSDAGASMSLTPSSASFTLAATVAPAAAGATYTFTKSGDTDGIVTINGNTVTVDPSGITANGTVTITAAVVGYPAITDTITLNLSNGSAPSAAKLYVEGGYYIKDDTLRTYDETVTMIVNGNGAAGVATGWEYASTLTSGTYYGVLMNASQSWYINSASAKVAKLIYNNSTGTLTVETYTNGSKVADAYFVTWDAENSRFVLSLSGTTTTATATGGGVTPPTPTPYDVTTLDFTSPVAVDLYTSSTATLASAPSAFVHTDPGPGTPSVSITWAEQTDAGNIGSIAGNTVTFTGTGNGYVARANVTITWSNGTTTSLYRDVVYNVTDSTPGEPSITSFTIDTPYTDTYTLSGGSASVTFPSTTAVLVNDTEADVIWTIVSGTGVTLNGNTGFTVNTAGTVVARATLYTTSGLTATADATFTINAEPSGYDTPSVTVSFANTSNRPTYDLSEYTGSTQELGSWGTYRGTNNGTVSTNITLTKGKSYILDFWHDPNWATNYSPTIYNQGYTTAVILTVDANGVITVSGADFRYEQNYQHLYADATASVDTTTYTVGTQAASGEIIITFAR